MSDKGVKIYCPLHEEIERLTQVQAEKLIHALWAAYTDEQLDSARDFPDDVYDFCPVGTMQFATDVELFHEHVTGMIKCRRDLL